MQIDRDRLREVLGLYVQRVEFRGVEVRGARETRIEIPDGQAQVVSRAVVSDRKLQIAKAGKIDAVGEALRVEQFVGVAAARARGFLDEVAFEMQTRLVHPVHLRQ